MSGEYQEGLEPEVKPVSEVIAGLREKESLRVVIAQNRLAFLDKLIYRYNQGELDETDVTEILEKVYIADGEPEV